MTQREQRQKAISTALAELAGNPFVPAAVRSGVAALAEETREQGERLDALEVAAFGKARG